MSWLTTVSALKRAGVASVVVAIVKVEGSAPRGVGTRMVVCSDTAYGTIGGGNLEYQALKTAREILNNAIAQPRKPAVIQQIAYTLGEDLVQCCGGRVTLMYEVFSPEPQSIVVFGAGHVGTELVRILSRLPLHLTWYDERPDYVAAARSMTQQSFKTDCTDFHSQHPNDKISGAEDSDGKDSDGKDSDGKDSDVRNSDVKNPNIRNMETLADLTVSVLNQPIVAVEQCPPQSLYVVLTHSHALDFELVEAIVSRDDTVFCGLIASQSKATAFRRRLRRKGFSADEVARLTAPIGVSANGTLAASAMDLTGQKSLVFAEIQKDPMVIAVAIAQQLLALPTVVTEASRSEVMPTD